MVFGSNSKFKLRSGHAKSSTTSGHTHSYLRRNVEAPCSVEGSYKKTPDTGDLIVPPVPAPRSLAPAPALTLPISTPITTVASKSAVVNSVAIGLAHKLTSNKIIPNNITVECEKTIKNNINNNKNQLPDVISSTSMTKNNNNHNNKTYLKDTTKLSYNNNFNNCDLNTTSTTKVTFDASSTVKSYVDLDCVATKLSALDIKEALPIKSNVPLVGNKQEVTNQVSDDICNGGTSLQEVRKYTKRASVAIQASETPLLFIESPSSECSPPSSPTDSSKQFQSSCVESIDNKVTSDVGSQTDDKASAATNSSEDSRVNATPSPTPSSVSSRAAQREEAECEQLSRDLASHLSPSDRLHNILAPVSEQKKVTDYVSGMFRLDIRATPRPSSRATNQTSCDQTSTNHNSASGQNSPVESPPPSPSRVNGGTPNLDNSSGSSKSNCSAEPLPADSAYFTTSEPKAMFLTRYGDCMAGPQISASEDLQRKKEELMSRLGCKLAVLREEALVVTEEARSNDALGAELQARLRAAEKPAEAAKLALHVEEIGTVTSLLLGLSGRLARAENALTGLPSCDEKRILEGKRDKLAEQLTEASQLKASIDRRSSVVATLLCKTLGPEAAADFEHFVHMKASLQVEARELDDRVRLGEEQLGALKETLSS